MIYIHAQYLLVKPPPARSITPDMVMNSSDFLNGYMTGLKGGLHTPEHAQTDPLTDEDIVEDIKRCVLEEPEMLAHALGCWVGLIIASCH